MAERTISDIDAEIAALKRERDLASLEGSKAVKAVLNTGKVATLAADLEALLPNLSTESVAAQQARNLISVLTNGRNLIDGEIVRVEGLTNTPAQPSPAT